MTSLPKRARSKRTSAAPVARVSEVSSLVVSPEMVSLTPSKQLAQAIDFSLTKASTEEGLTRALVMTIELLTGSYEAGALDDRQHAQRRPHPARLLCALVAGGPRRR